MYVSTTTCFSTIALPLGGASTLKQPLSAHPAAKPWRKLTGLAWVAVTAPLTRSPPLADTFAFWVATVGSTMLTALPVARAAANAPPPAAGSNANTAITSATLGRGNLIASPPCLTPTPDESATQAILRH